LVWSKSQQHTLTFVPEKLSFQIIVQEHFDLIQDEADKKNITLKMQQNGVVFFADRNMLNIILRNLLSNALKYSPVGGTIMISCDVVDHGLVVSVRDEGAGLGNMVSLFAPTNSHRDHNHGLGLILCKEFVEKHGGVITATNNDVKGACFQFTLPSSNASVIDHQLSQIDVVTPLSQQATDNLQKTGARPVVIIAEDDDQIRWYVKQILFPDFKVIEAVNGSDALELLSLETPDLIISDLMMPGVDGLNFCKQVKSNTATSHIPFIMLTAERSAEMKINGYEFGADDYVTKPIEPNVLRVRLHNILETRKRLMSIYQKDVTALPETFTSNSVDQLFLEKLNAIIEKQITDPELNPDNLAKEVSMSRTGLYMKVKALTGESVGIYIRNIRLKQSKKLLRERKLNISEVAYAVGFNQLPYFTTCFKEAFGITPTEFLTGKVK
jgi:DNA-binding response OmpR family regulator